MLIARLPDAGLSMSFEALILLSHASRASGRFPASPGVLWVVGVVLLSGGFDSRLLDDASAMMRRYQSAPTVAATLRFVAGQRRASLLLPPFASPAFRGRPDCRRAICLSRVSRLDWLALQDGSGAWAAIRPRPRCKATGPDCASVESAPKSPPTTVASGRHA